MQANNDSSAGCGRDAGAHQLLIALLGYRAGKYDEADRSCAACRRERFLSAGAVPDRLLQQRKNPEQAVKIFRNILAIEGALPRSRGPQELTDLALGGRSMRCSVSASQHAYEQLPRLLRHWDEALSSAYADLLNDDRARAGPSCTAWHSPHLSDEVRAESRSRRIIYHQYCLYPPNTQ